MIKKDIDDFFIYDYYTQSDDEYDKKLGSHTGKNYLSAIE